MHICMISREMPPQPGGIGYYVHNLSRKLVEKGNDVTIITRGNTKKSSRILLDGLEIYQVPFFPVYPLHIWVHGTFVNSLFRKLESKFDLVHLHSPVVPPLKSTKPIITTVHTPMKIDAKHHEVIDFFSLAERIQSSFFSPPIESKVFKISNLITSVSCSVANELKTYGLNPQKIIVVGNGVDEETFIPFNKDRSSEKYVLYTGNLHARKGIFDLLQCAEYVCRINRQVRFVVVGKGPFSRELDKQICKKGMQNKFIRLGHVGRSELIRLYQNSTVHVVPSHYEGLPTVLLEAMSCGIPVVATDVGGNSEAISSGINGFIVPPKQPKAMGDLIVRLLNDDILRERIGKAARKTVEEKYTWDKIAENIFQCYKKII